jgi:diaminopimelate epimerase
MGAKKTVGRQRPAKLRKGEFAKYQALGNDYLILDSDSFGSTLTANRIRTLCARHTGIGSDGILWLGRSKEADFRVRIFNPDGSEAEKSGNGVRILARFLFDLGYTRERSFSIQTNGGIVEAKLLLRAGRVDRIRLEIGRASFASVDIPVVGPEREVVHEPFAVNGRELRVTCVSVGNPHCVVFVPRLVLDELHRLGPLLENHDSFPNRINVQLACVRSRKRIDALIWERGAGETLSSGTSACAIAAAAVRNGLTENKVEIGMRGGELQLEVGADFAVRMTGTASPVYRGSLL